MESALWTLLSALVVLLCSSPECKGQDTVTQREPDVSVPQGDTASISCTFQTSGDTTPNLFWYKQEGHGAPQFMMKKMKSSTKWHNTFKATDFDESRFEVEAEQNNLKLKIQDVRVADSAVYYCALNTANKLIFGAGTRLSVQTSDDPNPSFYPLETDDTKVCLATGFSRHNKLQNIEIFNKTSAAFIDRNSNDDGIKGLYSQVALMSDGEEDQCPESSGGLADDTLQPDPALNLLSLTVLGLRILFIKTVAFNVLLTLRLFISR